MIPLQESLFILQSFPIYNVSLFYSEDVILIHFKDYLKYDIFSVECHYFKVQLLYSGSEDHDQSSNIKLLACTRTGLHE